MLINNSSTWFLSKRSETIASASIVINITLTNQLQRAQSLPKNINKQTDTFLPEGVRHQPAHRDPVASEQQEGKN